MVRVAADIGGTFTDVLFADDNGRVQFHKLPSTPPHYEAAVLEAIQGRLGTSSDGGCAVKHVVHASTVATNAVLEYRGARTALITTGGFRDVLELRRIRSPKMYDLFFQKPRELVERYLRFEISARVISTGEELRPVLEEELWLIRDRLVREQVQSVAVCLLHSYAYPEHEETVERFFRRTTPDLDVSISSAVLRERKEYERTATTVVNAYIRPVMRHYLSALRKGLSEARIAAPLLIMQSSGGLTPETDALRRPVFALESGPAAGVLAAAAIAQSAKTPNVLAFDMGGTTAKASLIEDLKIALSSEYEVGSSMSIGNQLVGGAGELIRAPSIDIAEVGAGGGSVAFLDSSSRLHVGPRSAGAHPGPVCYGREGTEPTVTDANLVLGYIRPGVLADGSVTLDIEAASRSIYDRIARPLGLSLLQAAVGIHSIANARIMRALRAVSVQRGRDPRGLVLLAYGGSGPIHAAHLAIELGMRRVMVPPLPGLFSAIGLLCSGVQHHSARSCLLAGDRLSANALAELREELISEVLGQFESEGFDRQTVDLEYAADLRYCGQSSEVSVNVSGQAFEHSALQEMHAQFELKYAKLYGHAGGLEDSIECTGLRLIGTVPNTQELTVEAAELPCSESQTRQAFGNLDKSTPVSVVSRKSLLARHRGPLLIDEYDSTIVVPPGVTAWVDENQNLMMETVL